MTHFNPVILKKLLRTARRVPGYAAGRILEVAVVIKLAIRQCKIERIFLGRKLARVIPFAAVRVVYAAVVLPPSLVPITFRI
jgi:hypothetical protein